MRFVIQSIPHAEHRYPTVGDYWWTEGGVLQVRVSEMDDRRSMILVAIHELVESLLAEDRGISEQSIMDFDVAHPDLAEPGESIEAPYHDEHVCAENIERLLAVEFGVNWQDHEAAVAALFPEE